MNGKVCKAQVETLYLCPGERGELVMTLTKSGHDKHRVKIKKGHTVFGNDSFDIDKETDPVFTNPDTVPDSDVWGKRFDCEALPGNQIAHDVKAQTALGTFHVKIGSTRFDDRIVVADDLVTIKMRYTNGEVFSPIEEFDKRENVVAAVLTDNLGPFSQGIRFENNVEHQAEFCPNATFDPNAQYIWKQSRTTRFKAFVLATEEFADAEPPENNVEDSPDPPFYDGTPSATRRIYSADAPKIDAGGGAPVAAVLLQRATFETWVEDSAGNIITPKYVWHSSITIVKMEDAPSTVWKRAGKNEVGPGPNVGLDPTKQEAVDAIKQAFGL